MFGFGKKEKTETLQEKLNSLTKKSDSLHGTHEISVQTLHKIIEETHQEIQLAEEATQKVHSAIGQAYQHKEKAKKLRENIAKEFPDV
jgi:uncharacterized coiled-coil DUF342 family protein